MILSLICLNISTFKVRSKVCLNGLRHFKMNNKTICFWCVSNMSQVISMAECLSLWKGMPNPLPFPSGGELVA